MSNSFAIPGTIAHQAPLSMGFPRQEYWNWLPFPPPGDLLDSGTELHLLHWQEDSLLLSHQGDLLFICHNFPLLCLACFGLNFLYFHHYLQGVERE